MAFNSPMPRMMRSNNTLRTQYSPASMTPGLSQAPPPRVGGGNQGNPGRGNQGPGAILPPPRSGVMGAGGGSSQPIAGGSGGFGDPSHLDFTPGADGTPGNSAGRIIDPMARGPQAPGSVSSAYDAPRGYTGGTPSASTWGATQQQGTPDFWSQWRSAHQFAQQQQASSGGGLGRYDPRKQRPDQAFGPFGSAAGGASNPPGPDAPAGSYQTPMPSQGPNAPAQPAPQTPGFGSSGQGLAPGAPAGGAPAEQGQRSPGVPTGSSARGLSFDDILEGGKYLAGAAAGGLPGIALAAASGGGGGGGGGGGERSWIQKFLDDPLGGSGVPTGSSGSPDYGRGPNGIDPGIPPQWRSDLERAMATGAPQMDPHATDELVQANDAALASRLADQREASAAEAGRARMGPGYQQGLAQKAGQQGAIAQSQMDAQTRYQVKAQNLQAQLEHYKQQGELARVAAQFAKSDDDRAFAANLQREMTAKMAQIQREMITHQHDTSQSLGTKDWANLIERWGEHSADAIASVGGGGK